MRFLLEIEDHYSLSLFGNLSGCTIKLMCLTHTQCVYVLVLCRIILFMFVGNLFFVSMLPLHISMYLCTTYLLLYDGDYRNSTLNKIQHDVLEQCSILFFFFFFIETVVYLNCRLN